MWEGSILFDMDHFSYNDTYARQALHGSPPPREFTYIYQLGWGNLTLADVAHQLAQINGTRDAVVLNLGAHFLLFMGLAEWQAYIDQVAALVASMQARVVWRTSFAVREEASRRRCQTSQGSMTMNTSSR